MKIQIALLTLSVQILYVHSNPCRWLDDGVDCVIQCLEGGGGSSTSLSGQVQAVYDEFPDCHSTGVKLIIPKHLTGYTVKTNWLGTLNINLTDLEIDAQFIMEFEANVFAHPVFATVKKLHFKNFRLNTTYDFDVSKAIFIGFDSLEDLMITNSAVKIFNNGWLDNINRTIKSLIVIGMGQEPPLMIEKLIGGSARILSNLDYVKIQYNLTNLINHLSFTAIPNVRELDLSDCRITVIADFSFEKLGSNLQMLNLERNNLETLSNRTFSGLSLSSSSAYSRTDGQNLIIRLSGNPWDCTCSLDHLKNLLIENDNFAGDVLCTTPDVIEKYPIKEAVFCPLPLTTDTTTEGTTLPVDIDDDDLECSSLNSGQIKTKISIQPQMQQIRITATPDGVSVTLQKYSRGLILIWFKSSENITDSSVYHQNSNASDCFTSLSHPIRIKDLSKDTSYTFCLMNISQQTVSPFDCISYYNHEKEEQGTPVWLYGSGKALTILFIVILCIAHVLIGVIIGATFLKFNGHEAFSFRLAFQCWNNRGDFKNEVNKNTPPPLPPHPLRDGKDDEVYYY